MTIALVNGNPLKSIGIDEYVYRNKFDTVTGATNPDGILDDDGETTFTHNGSNGEYAITFPSVKKPFRMSYGEAAIPGHEPNTFATVLSYTEATGVLLVTVYVNTAGTIVATDTNNIAVQVLAVFSKSNQGQA